MKEEIRSLQCGCLHKFRREMNVLFSMWSSAHAKGVLNNHFMYKQQYRYIRTLCFIGGEISENRETTTADQISVSPAQSRVQTGDLLSGPHDAATMITWGVYVLFRLYSIAHLALKNRETTAIYQISVSPAQSWAQTGDSPSGQWIARDLRRIGYTTFHLCISAKNVRGFWSIPMMDYKKLWL